MQTSFIRLVVAFITVLTMGLWVLQPTPVAAQGQSGTTLTADKTQAGHWEKTFHWTIDKSVTPATLDLFRGDSGSVQYTIQVTKDAGTTTAWIDGKICVTNGGAVATENLQIVDNLTMPPSNVVIASINVDVSSNPVLDPGETGCYPYRFDLLGNNLVAGATYKDTADITITNHSGHLGTPFGPNPSESKPPFPTSPTLINDTIHVDDTNGQSWTFRAGGQVSYNKTFTCDDDAGQHLNTATIGETNQSDNATVTVNCYALTVTKDATTSFKRTYNWTIDKSVTPETWNLFLGDSGTSEYTVAVKKTDYTDSDWSVQGNISVNNPAPMAATIKSVADVVSGNLNAPVNCGVSFPYALPAGQTLHCTYSTSLPDGTDRTNSATATLQNTPSGTTDFSGTAAVKFGDPTTEVNKSIHVEDSNGSSWTFDGSDSVTYNRTFNCEGGIGQSHTDNTATIVETQQSDKATVTVNCYDPIVTKDAHTSLKRTYHWSIDKSANQTSLTLAVNQSFAVNYVVNVDASTTDSDWAVSGNIAVYNWAPIDAIINSVSDVMSGVGTVEAECGVTFPYTLPAGETLHCTYSTALGDASSHTNTATATQQNYSYDAQGNATLNGTYDYTGSATVDFTSPKISYVDKCIAVNDSYAGFLGTVCAGVDTLPKKFDYNWLVGSYSQCGDYQATNTATFTTADTGTTGSDSWTIAIKVPCQGCTLTIGYWKTHAGFTGNNPDKVTPRLPQLLGTSGGAKTQSILTAAKAVQFLGFNGSNNVFDASNGINKLYAQLLAAKLNIANGADGSAVATTITAADGFLSTKNSLDWSGLSKTQKTQVLNWMTALDNYNNGLSGPGHCSEDGATIIMRDGTLMVVNDVLFIPVIAAKP